MILYKCPKGNKEKQKGGIKLNKYLLDYEIKSKGMTRQEVAEVLGMQRSTLYRKMNGVTEFIQSEIEGTPKGCFFRV